MTQRSKKAIVTLPHLNSSPSDDADAIASESVSRIPHPTTEYYIRDARHSDLLQVADLLALSFTPEKNDPIRKLFEMCRLQTTFPCAGERIFFLVACESVVGTKTDKSGCEERIIGFCKVDGRDRTDMFRTLTRSFPQFSESIPHSPYATDLAVHPDDRRRGIGSDIMREVEFRAKIWNVESLFLGVESDNESALSLYRMMGYEIFIEGMVGSEDKGVHLLRRRLL